VAELVYQLDSYAAEIDGQVAAVREDLHAVALDRTIFYPGGGGQPADKGQLNGLAVTSLRRSDGEVWHALDGPLPPVGSKVHVMLDWERRYKLMRTHTAMHVLCGVVFQDYGALVTGGDMEPLKGRMDFEFPRLERELVTTIEASVNAEINKAHDVRVNVLPRAEAFQIPDLIRTKINLLPAGIEQVRTVEIVGLDLQADGGTHVRNTREVGSVRFADYKSKGAINKRIYLELIAP
jgi:misacylated tRNA(Ala) deacylase